ncbi:MAG: hypothetical protein J0M08_14105 [Bacteroidetes bacterium]|nr:hypothetical protein [Bacteroidota bacterium]
MSFKKQSYFIYFLLIFFISKSCYSLIPDSLFLNAVSPKDTLLNVNVNQDSPDFFIHNYFSRFLSGSIGSVSIPLSVNTNCRFGSGFTFNEDLWGVYKVSFDKFGVNEKFKIPTTSITYIGGSKKEQFVRVNHSQFFKKGFFIDFNFFRTRSEGWFLRENTNHNSLKFSFGRIDSSRYKFEFSLLFNRLRKFENGGVSNDSLFLVSDDADFKAFNVSLLSAERREKSNNITYKHSFSLRDNIVLFNDIAFRQSAFFFTDKNISGGTYYLKVVYDSLETNDSAIINSISNKLGIKISTNRNNQKFYYLQERHDFLQVANDTLFSNHSVGADLNGRLSSQLTYSLGGQYFFYGYNSSDNLFFANIDYRVKKKSEICLGLSFNSNRRKPDNIYLKYNSNNYVWKNSFNQIYLNEFGGNFSILFGKRNTLLFNTRTSLLLVDNYTYFDSFSISRQYDDIFSVFSSVLSFDVLLKKRWRFLSELTFQSASNNYVVRVPEIIYHQLLGYDTYLFKKAMRFFAGVELYYFSTYYSSIYNPALNGFYLQNLNKVGGYPFVDFFVNAKIKTFSFFVKTEHINADLMGRNFFLSPKYPSPGRAFKLGVIWRLFN